MTDPSYEQYPDWYKFEGLAGTDPSGNDPEFMFADTEEITEGES